jgi:hypothetical protein
LEFAFQMTRRGSCLLKAHGICDLPITSGLNFSPVVEHRRAMVSFSLASLPIFHFSPCCGLAHLSKEVQFRPRSRYALCHSLE